MPLLLALLEGAFGPIINWLLGKSSDKAKQEQLQKEAEDVISDKNKEVQLMAAPDRSDGDVVISLRKREQPDA